MGRRRKASTGEKKRARKTVTVKLLEREHAGKVTTAYRLMEELIDAHHPRLEGSKIAIAWRFGKRSDADGRLWLGSMKKGSDLDRTMHGYDGVLTLNHEVWNSSDFSEAQMRALLDHELCHLDVMNDSNGDPKLDEEGRKVYRIRKHDVEEFTEIVARHGCWKDDLRRFAEHAMDRKEKPLLPAIEKPKPIDEELNGKATTNGHAATKNGRPKRVRLLKPAEGFESDGLSVGSEVDVAGWRKGLPMVKSEGGQPVTLREDQFEAVGAA